MCTCTHRHTPTTHTCHVSSMFVLGTDHTQHIYVSPRIHIPHYIHPTHHAHIPANLTHHTLNHMSQYTHSEYTCTYSTHSMHHVQLQYEHTIRHTHTPPHIYMYHTSIPHITYTHTPCTCPALCIHAYHTHIHLTTSHTCTYHTHVYILCLSPN